LYIAAYYTLAVLNSVLCLVVYTCSAFHCISAVLSCVTTCWLCYSVLSATIIN